MKTFPLIAALALVPSVASALTIAPANFYSDVRGSSPEAAGINLLTRERIVQGYSDGRFGSTRVINRAEFLKIAMKATLPNVDFAAKTCFPDVLVSDWFSPFVCAAKERRIISGKTVPIRADEQPYFDPAATVTYGEALKMLTLLSKYAIPNISAPHWAEPYYRAAAEQGVDLQMTIDLDHPLTRALSARLAAAFVAKSQGQLAALRLAEAGQYSVSSSSSSTSSSSSRSSSVSSSSSSVSSAPLDPLADTNITAQFALLGETSPILGAGKIYLYEEPLMLTDVVINLTTELPTVRSLLVYDDDRRYLGRAPLDPSASTNRSYKLQLAPDAFTLGKAEERTIYVRADIASRDAGGLGNQNLQISNIVVKGNGVWSSHQYTQQTTSNASYPLFITARSTLTSVTNAGPASSSLVLGPGRVLGTFTFAGRKTDSSAHIDVTDLSFDLNLSGGVGISNAQLAADGMTDKFPCVANSSQITCTLIPDLYGSLTDGPRTLTVYGDVTATDPTHAGLQLTLNNQGTSTSAGAVTWSDGTNTFHWVSLPNAGGAVAAGTHYTY